MGKKKKGYGKIVSLTVILVMILGLASFAAAEFVYFNGTRDKQDYSFGKDGRSSRTGWINEIWMEGATSNAFETKIVAVDPTADRIVNVPNASGTIALTEDISTSMTLSDAKALMGNSSDLATEVTLSLTTDVTCSFTNSGACAAALAADSVDSNEIAANAVGASELNRIVNTLVIASGGISNAIGDNALYNADGYTVTPRNNVANGAWIANTTMDVNGNVTVFVNDTLASDFTVEIVRWAP
jgi:hypothetical protein